MKMDCGRSRVRSSSPATFFLWYWSWNNFYGHSFPSADSSRAVVNYWRNDLHLALVNRLGSLSRNNVVRLTDRLDMTIVVEWDVKPKIKQYKSLNCCRFLNDSESFPRTFAEFFHEMLRRTKKSARTYANSAKVHVWEFLFAEGTRKKSFFLGLIYTCTFQK